MTEASRNSDTAVVAGPKINHVGEFVVEENVEVAALASKPDPCTDGAVVHAS